MVENYEIIDSKWLSTNIHLLLKKRVVVITGAGISVSSGIPDFRSKQGLFASIRNKHKFNGKDLFEYRFGYNEDTRPIYYKFISDLKAMTEKAVPSPTHDFLYKYRKYNKKYRIYTQNIDSLEERVGINTENLVYLHGNLNYLVCTMCGHKIEYTDSENNLYKEGKTIECTKCINANIKRKINKIRPLPMGFYHTNIIHYDQPHHDGYKIARLFESDMDLDLFIVMGTSLKVYGVKEMVKRGLRKAKMNNGKGVLVNLEEPSREFREMFDYFWKGDCDSFSEEVLKNIEIAKIDQRLSILNVKDDEQSFIRLSKNKNKPKIDNVNKENLDPKQDKNIKPSFSLHMDENNIPNRKMSASKKTDSKIKNREVNNKKDGNKNEKNIITDYQDLLKDKTKKVNNKTSKSILTPENDAFKNKEVLYIKSKTLKDEDVFELLENDGKNVKNTKVPYNVENIKNKIFTDKIEIIKKQIYKELEGEDFNSSVGVEDIKKVSSKKPKSTKKNKNK